MVWPPETSSTTSGSSRSGSSRNDGVEVALEVVDGHERHVPHEGERLGRADADQQRADQPGPGGGGHRVDLVVGHAGLDERLGHDRGEHLDVGAAGDLGHDAAVAGVLVDLAGDDRRPHPGGALDDRGGGLVARGLDAEDAVAHAPIVPRRRGRVRARRGTTPSAPSSPTSWPTRGAACPPTWCGHWGVRASRPRPPSCPGWCARWRPAARRSRASRRRWPT